ncbi:MAG: sugar phosphate isomerase/epimerase [Gemmatimonadaceae bacterium]|nr:sugar phosphate isomerase/epimerase [Gemmatimonadaceae bacterium]
MERRTFLQAAVAAATVPGLLQHAGKEPPFRISLAQWSFHKALFAKEMEHLDFARIARRTYGIKAIEYVNIFFKDKATDAAYLAEMNRRARDEGVYQHLIMVDGEGALGDPDAAKRAQAVDNHRKWLDAAKTLGCATIRVNAQSTGTPDEQQKLAADGLRRLVEVAAPMQLNVIVENHGGLSSHGDWLVGVMQRVDHPRMGTLPDFGNFYDYDRYQAVTEMMPYAKAVSAKSFEFDAAGNETTIDFPRMLRIVLAARFHGWVGIEFEGERTPEPDGVRGTLALLKRLQSELA